MKEMKRKIKIKTRDLKNYEIESKDTATAAATTYLLEFGIVSLLTGNRNYWEVAKK